MIKQLEHIGIAVKSLESAQMVFDKLFEHKPYKSEAVASEAVETTFYKVGNVKVELLVATDEGSAISKYIEKRGEGIHHLAFEVDDIDAEMERLGKAGFRLLNEAPKAGADNKRIFFVHPKDANGVLVELCQEKS